MKKLLVFTALATVLAASESFAAGFQLREQSAAAQGNAFAGATAGAENPSYAFFNAAGLTRQKGLQVNVGGTYIAPEATAQNIQGGVGERGEQHNIVHSAIAPNGTVSYQLNDDTFLGMSVNSPFGMITKYNDDWAGAAHGNASRIHVITVTPMAAYKVTDKFSLGFGLPIEKIRARLTNKSLGNTQGTAVHGDTTDIGYQLGAMYEFTDKTRVGIGYRSEMKHKIHGEMESTAALPFMNQDINADLDLPATLSIGAYHEINDKWAVMAEYQRTFWSSFDRLVFTGEERPGLSGYRLSTVYENWRDTNFYAIGASYNIDNQWKARFGLAYDQTAVKLANRTPRIPDSDRIWYSFGLGYQYNERLSFDMAFTYIDAKDATVNTAVTQNGGNALNPDVYVDYKNSVKMWGLSLNYKF